MTENEIRQSVLETGTVEDTLYEIGEIEECVIIKITIFIFIRRTRPGDRNLEKTWYD